ncbi:MAG: hypothetical protein F4077_00605 [Gammaproteobacteria bacterium]|nr:hypothetical protein [Gammaproteobacteria bacterium]MYI76259.1 hypothetical protein [Gammaproteobacteria bacterium]
MSYDQRADYQSFKKQLPKLLDSHAGKSVVFRNGQLVQVFDDRQEALSYARYEFGIGNYIVQEVQELVSKPASRSLLAGQPLTQ